MKHLQPSMSIDDQIENLKSKGLTISNEEFAHKFLNDVSYYRLIKGFSIGLKEKNGDVPFYALAETLSFGTLSRLYKNLNTEDKASIASIYHLKYSYLESWIETIAYVRNLCAHYGRLYNVKLTKTPKLYQSERKANIGNQRIFGVICCMKYLIQDHNDWNEFVNELDTLIAKYQYVNTELMGFTNDWKSYLLFDLTEDGEQ